MLQRCIFWEDTRVAETDKPLLIKRYASRRLYNTETSDYVTLEDISQFIRDGRDVPVRLHLESVIEDVFEGAHLRTIVERIARGGRGVVIYLREGSVGVSRASERPRPPLGEEGHGSASERGEQWREIGLGAQILNDLGVSTIRLVTSRERHYVGLSGYGIDITSTDIIDG